jgi:signal transduction histidine kinase
MAEEPQPLSDERRERLLTLIMNAVRGGFATVQAVRARFSDGDGDGIRTLPLDTIVRDVARQLRISASERGIDLAVATPWPDAPVDAERVPLILYNLVTNAIEHHDRPNHRGQVALDVTQIDRAIVVTVADDGPGFREGDRPRSAGLAARVDPASPKGLGLAVVREAVEQIGGTVWSEPNEPRGTRMSFSIPVAEAQPG